MTLSSKSRGDLPFPAWGKWRSPLSVGVLTQNLKQ
jgi:hypothetical protein